MSACSIPVADQLAHIAKLEDGWLDGEGTAVSATAIARAQAVLDVLVPLAGIGVPYLYADIDFGIRAEWDYDDIGVVLFLERDSARLRLLVLDGASEDGGRRERYGVQPDDLDKLADVLRAVLS